MALEEQVSEMWSWLHFFVSTVLPVAGHELLRWLYEWQVLVAGILAVVAAHIWGRSVVRAARYAAMAGGAAAEQPAVRKSASVVSFPSRSARKMGMTDRVFQLREQIRMTLGKMPCTDDVLSPASLAECRKIANMPLGEPPKGASKKLVQSYEVLRGGLSALGALRDADTCRKAWEALVRINADARELLNLPEAAPAARRA